MADQNKPLSRLRRGQKRTKKRRNDGGRIVAPLVGLAFAMMFLVWIVVSFQALTSTQVTGKPLVAVNDVRRASLAGGANDLQPASGSSGMGPYQSPLLIFTCSRANYLAETLDTIYQHIPTACIMGCPIVVSQDRDIQDVSQVIDDFKVKFEQKGIPFYHIQHPSSPNLRGNPYQLLAVHYGWALRTLFDGKAYDKYSLPERVIILEEDLRVAPDFFSYFEATAPFLDMDPNLLAISAFNDNGYQNQVADSKRLLRSDFFPGLGWMMTRKTWVNDLGSKWPNGYWDDWLREPDQRRGRQFIRPEITRTFHFGEKGGASQNQFGANHHRVMLNMDNTDWKSQDLSYLEDATFSKNYAQMVANAKLVGSFDEAMEQVKLGIDVRIEYNGIQGFAALSRRFNLMTDEKAGIFRTAYKGVVETRPLGQNFAFLTPPLAQLQQNFGTSWPLDAS
jgi:alpha-1,3-mannosyl-glycoprotein beta-1,2-N-acetylglucosaminyltransferase